MIYKFQSQAAGDVIMNGPIGDVVLGLIGKASAAQGIIEPAAMPAAIKALNAAMEAAPAAPDGEAAPDSDEARDAAERVNLRARIWPFVQLLERSLAENTPVTWGV